MWSIIIFLFFIILFTLSFRGLNFLINNLGGKSFHILFTDSEFIVENHKVPYWWGKKWNKKNKKGKNLVYFHKKAKKWSVKKLNTMIKYYKTSNLVEEQARPILLEQLNMILLEWKNKEWKDIIPSDK